MTVNFAQYWKGVTTSNDFRHPLSVVGLVLLNLFGARPYWALLEAMLASFGPSPGLGRVGGCWLLFGIFQVLFGRPWPFLSRPGQDGMTYDWRMDLVLTVISAGAKSNMCNSRVHRVSVWSASSSLKRASTWDCTTSVPTFALNRAVVFPLCRGRNVFWSAAPASLMVSASRVRRRNRGGVEPPLPGASPIICCSRSAIPHSIVNCGKGPKVRASTSFALIWRNAGKYKTPMRTINLPRRT